MKRIGTELVVVSFLFFGASTCIMAQVPTADRFLDGVSARPAGDEAEGNQSGEVVQALNIASPSEVERVLPTVLRYVRPGNEQHLRGYAVMFLLSISLRPDGAALLSSSSEEISSLIVDADPGIQQAAVGIADYLIGRPATKNQPYLTAMQTAMQRPKTAQLAGVNMALPLLVYGSGDQDSLKSVLAFLHRDDLTPWIRGELVHELGVMPGVPEELNPYLVSLLSDPDPHVRANALVAYADSRTPYRAAAKDRVQKIANDSQEIEGIRELARQAIAGKTGLSPNYDAPPLVLDPITGAMPQKSENQ